MNYQKNEKIVDGYRYIFYGDIGYKNEMIAYAQMSKRFMNKPFNSPLDIVGNYDWHQKFPYEQYILKDEVPSYKDAKIIDFGCGPGRMVERIKKFCDHVDGIDISEYAVAYARENIPNSNFYISSGIDVGDAPENTYDLVFCTISLQHIPCKTIRKNLYRGFFNILKPGGKVALQVAYNPAMKAGVWSPDTTHASYDSDFWNAKATNGHADMVINKDDLKNVRGDFLDIFENVHFEFVNVSEKYHNLDGAHHAHYWATDWLFIHAQKGI